MISLEELIAAIMSFAERKTKEIIVELQKNRFDNQGQFNDNERWQNNSVQVIRDKGINLPLIDSGELMGELENTENWDLQPKISKALLTLTIPDTEDFTDSKYDKLQTGGPVNPYVSRRGRYIDIHGVPARNFKNLSAADIAWIKTELVNAIRREYE